MAKIYRFEQTPFFVNSEVLLADSFEFTNTASLNADYALSDKNTRRVFSSRSIQNEIKVSYFPSYKDLIYSSIKNEEPMEYSLGGINFGKGFVSNYSLEISSQGLIRANAIILIFQNPKNKLNGLSLQNTNRVSIKKESDDSNFQFAQSSFTKIEQSLVKIPIDLNFNFESEIYTTTRIGESYPSEIRYGKKQIFVSLSSEYINKFVVLEGENASIKIKLRDICDLPLRQKHYSEYLKSYYTKDDEIYSCFGKIQSINSSVAANDWLKSNINIVQFI